MAMNEPINEGKEGYSVDISKLLLHYVRRWWLFVIAAVLFAAIAFGYTKKFVTPTYIATVRMYVNNFRSEEKIESISTGTLSASQNLVNTYVALIKSDSIIEEVVEIFKEDNPDSQISASQLKGMISASKFNDTQVLNLQVTHTDPRVAAGVANVVAEVSIGKLSTIIEGSSVKIIDPAKVPTAPSSPNTFKNTLYGGIGGGLLVLVYLTIVFLLDVEIKDSEELEQLFNIPVLGQIPDFNENEQKRGYSYKRKHGRHSKKSVNPYEYVQTVEESQNAQQSEEQEKGGKKE